MDTLNIFKANLISNSSDIPLPLLLSPLSFPRSILPLKSPKCIIPKDLNYQNHLKWLKYHQILKFPIHNIFLSNILSNNIKIMIITINHQDLKSQHNSIMRTCINLNKGIKMKEWIQFSKSSIPIMNLEINNNKGESKMIQIGLVVQHGKVNKGQM